MPPVFKGATCKGSFSLGTACGQCERCQWEQAKRNPPDVGSGGSYVYDSDMTIGELAAVFRERDVLASALREIQVAARTYGQPDRRDLWKWIYDLGRMADEALAVLERDERS